MAKVLGYTAGVYDMFHVGHLNILNRAKMHCDELVVGVTTDELASTKKGKPPVISYEERCDILRALRLVDHVVPQSTFDKVEAWELYRFHVIFVGSDWQGTEAWNRYESEFALRNVQVMYFPYTSHTSSTLLRSALDKLGGDA